MTYKAAVTLDGKVAAAGGDARWISCLDSRRAVHELRARVDAVMVGAGTVRRDDPELTVRLADGRDPVRVVVTHDGELPPDAKVLATARQTRTIVRRRARRRRPRAGCWRRAAPSCSRWATAACAAALEALAGRGLLDILCEGGPTLAGELLAAGLIDRVLLFVAPLIVGRGAPDLFAAPAVAAVDGAWRLQDVAVARRSATTCCSAAPSCAGRARCSPASSRRSARCAASRPAPRASCSTSPRRPCTEDAAVGDSILTDGVCLTVTSLRAGRVHRRRHARDRAPHDARPSGVRATASTSSAR